MSTKYTHLKMQPAGDEQLTRVPTQREGVMNSRSNVANSRSGAEVGSAHNDISKRTSQWSPLGDGEVPGWSKSYNRCIAYFI